MFQQHPDYLLIYCDHCGTEIHGPCFIAHNGKMCIREKPGLSEAHFCSVHCCAIHHKDELPAGFTKLSGAQFRALLSLVMCADPWPDSVSSQFEIEGLLREESEARGFSDWQTAYHEFKIGGDDDASTGDDPGDDPPGDEWHCLSEHLISMYDTDHETPPPSADAIRRLAMDVNHLFDRFRAMHEEPDTSAAALSMAARPFIKLTTQVAKDAKDRVDNTVASVNTMADNAAREMADELEEVTKAADEAKAEMMNYVDTVRIAASQTKAMIQGWKDEATGEADATRKALRDSILNSNFHKAEDLFELSEALGPADSEKLANEIRESGLHAINEEAAKLAAYLRAKAGIEWDLHVAFSLDAVVLSSAEADGATVYRQAFLNTLEMSALNDAARIERLFLIENRMYTLGSYDQRLCKDGKRKYFRVNALFRPVDIDPIYGATEYEDEAKKIDKMFADLREQILDLAAGFWKSHQNRKSNEKDDE